MDECRAQWRCPHGGHAMARDPGELPPPCREALRRTEKLVGAPLPPTCPQYATTFAWVHAAAYLWELRETRSPERFYPPLTPALVEAVVEFGRGVSAARADDMRRKFPPAKKDT